MSGRLTSLDVLRSLAIILVMTAHIILGFGAPASLAPLQLGGIGVDLFFVLSGWLLGGQLFREVANTNSIDIRRFWYRRWIRTLPAYYAVLGFVSFQQLITKENWHLPLDYLVFVQNYNQPFEIFHVSWSLAVEEQFYLLVAPVVFLIWRFRPSVRLAILLAFLATPGIFRLLGWYDNEYQTHIRIDGCIAGVLLAYLKNQHVDVWRFLEKHSAALFGLSTVMFALYFFQRYVPLPLISDPDIIERALVFSGWLVFAVTTSGKAYWHIPGAHYIATRSYALYLLHPEAIALINRLDLPVPFLIYYGLVFGLSLMIAEVLYRTVELPFLSLRDRIVPAKTVRVSS
ncbi:acyltransferase family protein [Marinobacter oulmenensis]|uniref:Peptidoglycan/LPS O-acetylase OafA/YrhL n=1 Tax=Marinobacter oulmenensis TaxID=643747 RepID=A0A840U4P3_9GAMM|nr:acyltransferase [Marinobacter oulmenensis]MBB5320694.1 peptidoglycan/LPS O-acetylase OafA/YrhL [Marinobacter oulmenensis]